MSRDSQRYRKVYSYYRPQPRTELLEIVVDETLDWKNSVRAASIVTLPYGLTGPTDTIEIDGVNIVDGDRVLLRCQDDASENGIYYFEVTDGSYTMSRASDARQETLSCGAATYVEEGTSNGGKIYILSTTNPITVGSTNLTWTEFSSGGGGLGGSGTTNYVSKFTAAGTLGNSIIRDDGTNVAIGTAPTTAKFHVSSSLTGSAASELAIGSQYFGTSINLFKGTTQVWQHGDGTESMRITNGKNLLLNAFGQTARFYVSGSSTSETPVVVIKGGVDSPVGPLLDIKNVSNSSIFYVSASSVIAAGDQVEITGSLSVTNGISGSLTNLTNGTPYLIAGPNITINTGSNGAVQITGSAGGGGPSGTGTSGYLSAWTSSTSLGDSHIYYWTGAPSITTYRYKAYNNQFVSLNDTVQLVLETDNTTGARVGINSSVPQYPLDVSEGIAGTSTIASFRNTDVSGGTDRGIQMYMGAGNFNPGTFRLLHEWKTDRHYTRFRTTNLSSLSISGPVEDLLVLSSDRKVLVTGSLSVRYDGSSQVGTVVDVQKLDGNQIMWISSSAGSNPVGSDVFMWVSGSRTDNNTGTNKVVFGGDVRISGSLTVGTGSVFLTSNDIQFGSSGIRIQKSGNDMKFFDLNNTGGKTLTELAATGGGGGGSSPEYWSSPSSAFVYATGSVGIGSTSHDSSYKLNVYQTTNFDDLRVKFEQVGADYGSKVYLVGGNTAAPGGASTNELSSHYRDEANDLAPMWRVWGGYAMSNMAFDTGGVEAMRINASQNVGIGITSPQTKLHVSAASGVQIEATNGSVSQRVGYCLSGVAYSGTSTGHPYALLTADVERMRIDTSGNVGIGTSSISARLHVSGSGTGTTTTLIAKHGVANGSSLPVLNIQNSAGDSLLYVSGSGFVGVGTSTASATTNFLKALGGNVVSITGPSASALLLEVNGNLSGSMVVSNSGMTVVPGANRTLGLGSDNSVKLSIDTEGDINLQTSSRYFDASISSGQGIRLRSTPGNSDAQVLDAYYEKDLVVTLKSLNSDLDCALYSNAQTLKFTRIGRMVTISGYLQVETVTSTGTGRLYIDLGTTTGERPSSSSAVALYINQPAAAVDWNNPVIAYADGGTSRIYIDRYDAGQGLSNGLTLSQFVEVDQEFMISVSYSTN